MFSCERKNNVSLVDHKARYMSERYDIFLPRKNPTDPFTILEPQNLSIEKLIRWISRFRGSKNVKELVGQSAQTKPNNFAFSNNKQLNTFLFSNRGLQCFGCFLSEQTEPNRSFSRFPSHKNPSIDISKMHKISQSTDTAALIF